jgi:hypothetical protein
LELVWMGTENLSPVGFEFQALQLLPGCYISFETYLSEWIFIKFDIKTCR